MKSLPNNPSLFIKKASQGPSTEEYIAQNSFESFKLAPILKSNIDYKGYATLTPIQDQAISHILEGRDLIGLAETGTGKTAAFLIPLIQQMHCDRSKKTLIIGGTGLLIIVSVILETAKQVESHLTTKDYEIFSKRLR